MFSISINKTSGIEITQGLVYEAFLSNLPWLSKIERERLIASSIEILKNCVPPIINHGSAEFNDTTGLVLGYVQSGKTLSFTSVMALACDNGYRVAILIGGRTNLLLNQNTKRLKSDIGKFDSISVAQNESSFEFGQKVLKRLENSKNRMIVVTVLKHQDHLKNLADIFTEPFLSLLLKKRSVLIFDDESDQASLNTFANANSKKEANNESAIFKSIKYLRSKLPNHSYIQYTATPQANLLIDYLDMLSPDWHVLIEPGENYTGGEAFFKSGNSNKIVSIPDEERYHYKDRPLIYPPKGLKDAIYNFILSSIFLCYNKFKLNKAECKLERTSLMIHPCFRKDSINKFYTWTKLIVQAIQDSIKNDELAGLQTQFNKYLDENGRIFSEVPEFNEVIEAINEDFLDNLSIHEVVGDAERTEFPWDEAKHHILVGGQLLDRGFTVEDLIVTYMPRDTKGPNNADTIEQRCRFFGYKKRYFEFCKLYLPLGLKTDYESYVDHEVHLRKTLAEYSMSEFKRLGSPMLSNNGLNLTNKSRLSQGLIETAFKGYKYFEPPLNYKKNNELIEHFLREIETYNFINVLKPKDKRDQQDNNTHKVFGISKLELINLLSRYDVGNPEENIQKSHIERLLANSKESFPDKVFIIEIAYLRKEGRPRTIKKSKRHRGNPYEISALASNYPSYFGDSKLLKTDDSGKSQFNYQGNLVVQIHRIFGDEKTEQDNPFFQRTFYTLAFAFPDNVQTTVISKII